MATGGRFSRTLEGGHQTFYDIPCSLCEKENKHVEAIKYCEECFIYLCDHCLIYHNKFPLHQRHQLLNQSQFTTVNMSALVSFPTKRCPKHPGELINIFCGNHDIVCCSVCKALEHSSCVKTQHLPYAAKGIQSSQEFQKIVTGARTFVADVDKVLNDRNADLSRIAKEKQSVRKTIEDFRKKINKYFDDLEKNSLAELDHREEMIVSRIYKDKVYLETTKSKAEDILKQLESFNGDNECDLFVQVKTGSQFLDDAVEKIRAITETGENPSIQFEINRNIEQYLTPFKSLGSFESTGTIATPPQISAIPAVKTSSVPVVPAKQQSEPDVECLKYKKQKCETFYITEMFQTEKCNISSICQLPDDTFLITDGNNRKLRRLDQSLKPLDSLQLPSIPHSVCAAGQGQAAMTLVRYNKILLVSLGQKLERTRSFSVHHKCRGIVYFRYELFVCCGDYNKPQSYRIEVYTKEGLLQRRFNDQPNQQHLPSVPNYITVSDDGQHLLVTSFEDNDVYMLDDDCKVVNSFRHESLRKAEGICTDGTGQVFVCGYNSNTVVQLSPKHQKIEVVLREEDGISGPQGVYYDKDNSRLLVSCYNTNKLSAFTLMR